MTFPTDKEALDSEWHIVGPAEISRKENSLVINPAAVDDPSLVWSRERIPSDNFEVTIVLGAVVPGGDVNSLFDVEGVGIWYVYEGPEGTRKVTARNYHRKDKKKAGRKGRFQLFGYKNDYDGLGCFLFFDAGSPMMTMLANSPPTEVMREDATGATYGIGLYDAFHTKKTEGEIKIKLSVRPNKATVEVLGRQGGKVEVDGVFRAGGYIGLTALSASYQKDDTLVPTLVEIKDLKVKSNVPLVELPPDQAEAKIKAYHLTMEEVAKPDSQGPSKGPPSETESLAAPAPVQPTAAKEEPPAGAREKHVDPGLPARAAAPQVESGLRRQLRVLRATADAQKMQLAAIRMEVKALRAEL